MVSTSLDDAQARPYLPDLETGDLHTIQTGQTETQNLTSVKGHHNSKSKEQLDRLQSEEENKKSEC